MVHVLAELPGMHQLKFILPRSELTVVLQDRNAIALARLNTLEEDLNLTPTQYQTCVAVLFAG